MEDAADICFVLPFSNRLSNWKAQQDDSFRCNLSGELAHVGDYYRRGD